MDSSWAKARRRLILEELEHARDRGAHIYAEVLGYSLNNDAFHMTTPLPTGESCIRAMRDALADAALAPEQIDYVNAHASSTQLNDSTETMAIKEVFGEHAQANSGQRNEGVITAHPLGATGAIEAAICALAIERQWVPPTINYQNPDPSLRPRCRSESRPRGEAELRYEQFLRLRRHQRLHCFGQSGLMKTARRFWPAGGSREKSLGYFVTVNCTELALT